MRLYNTMTRAKEDFVPLEPGKVRMYACGPTVYNYFHIGNARAFVVFDTLRRFFEYSGYKVDFVQNFTDIDDKMIQRAQIEEISVAALAERYITEYFTDADGLGILRPTVQPRATQSIDEILAMIQTLVDRDFAYETADGVYFDVSRVPTYGKLSRHNLEDLQAGASERTSGEDKRNPMDFVLWKKKKPGEPAWSSPWGEGRPGWHIECSAMIRKTLGDTIDIHGGGQDLVFPHHENEIAQSESATGKPFVRYWMHNGFITIDDEKMSKSAGNFFTVRDIAQRFSYAVIRFFLLSAHYRMPINYNIEMMNAAQSGLQRIRNSVENLDFFAAGQQTSDQPDAAVTQALSEATARARTCFVAALKDDLNTADALAAIFDLVRAANTAMAQGTAQVDTMVKTAAVIRELCGVLGLDLTAVAVQTPDAVQQLVFARTAAKQTRDFARADALRDQIKSMGYQVEDTPQGPKVTPL